MNETLIIGGMATLTFAIRYVMFGASSRITLSPALLRALRYLPPVMLTAIVAPEIFLIDGGLQMSYSNARLVGAIAAVIIGRITQNLLLTIVLGMAIFFGWQSVLGTL